MVMFRAVLGGRKVRWRGEAGKQELNRLKSPNTPLFATFRVVLRCAEALRLCSAAKYS